MKKLIILSLFLCFSVSLFSQKVYVYDSDVPIEQQCTVKIGFNIKVKEIDGWEVKLKSKKMQIPDGEHTFLLEVNQTGMAIFQQIFKYEDFKAGHTYKMLYHYSYAGGWRNWGWYVKIKDVTKK